VEKHLLASRIPLFEGSDVSSTCKVDLSIEAIPVPPVTQWFAGLNPCLNHQAMVASWVVLESVAKSILSLVK